MHQTNQHKTWKLNLEDEILGFAVVKIWIVVFKIVMLFSLVGGY
jgi:hypothetical protein